MLPLVSIVTPSFNQGRFLRRTIDSVLAQDYPRIEYLVFDGGSRDDSVEILRSYGNRFFWRSGPDGGQSDAINQGFGLAKGDIFAWLNSDDVLLPGAVSSVVNRFRQHPDCDLLYGNAHFIDECDRVLGDYPTAPYDFDRLLESCCICQPAAFWRRSVLDRIGPLDDSLHYAMDYDYWMRLDRTGGKLLQVPEVLACSRVHARDEDAFGPAAVLWRDFGGKPAACAGCELQPVFRLLASPLPRAFGRLAALAALVARLPLVAGVCPSAAVSIWTAARRESLFSAAAFTFYTCITMRMQNTLSANGADDPVPPVKPTNRLVELREILRYVPQYRDKVFVIAFDGAIVEHDNFRNLLLDLALLRSLRIGVVLSPRRRAIRSTSWRGQPGKTPSNLDGTGITDAARCSSSLDRRQPRHA